MKHFNLITIAATLIATASVHGQTQMAGLSNGMAAVHQELQKVQVAPGGMQVRYSASPSEVTDAINKLGGKATVDFGNRQLKVDIKSSSGVIIGSPADGLVATSNVSAAGPVVVNVPVPLQPKMSITVVGGKSFLFCVDKIETDSEGNVIPGGSYVDELNSDSDRCSWVGKSYRINKPGKYYLKVDKSEMIVDVKDGENKVIPLREIVIPAPKVSDEIKYGLYRDFESSTVEQEKLLVLAYAIMNNRKSAQYFDKENCKISFNEFKNTFKLLSTENGFQYVGMNQDWSSSRLSQFFIYYKAAGNFGKTLNNQLGATLYVLPGVYGIAWNIGGQLEVTKGIYVQ